VCIVGIWKDYTLKNYVFGLKGINDEFNEFSSPPEPYTWSWFNSLGKGGGVKFIVGSKEKGEISVVWKDGSQTTWTFSQPAKKTYEDINYLLTTYVEYCFYNVLKEIEMNGRDQEKIEIEPPESDYNNMKNVIAEIAHDHTGTFFSYNDETGRFELDKNNYALAMRKIHEKVQCELNRDPAWCMEKEKKRIALELIELVDYSERKKG
jgi:hypothetical protein